VSRLEEKVKNTFCLYLEDIRLNRNGDLCKCKLTFIDNDESNCIFSYLCKPRNFNILRKLHCEEFTQKESD